MSAHLPLDQCIGLVYAARMAGTPLTRELYERMVAAFRECPGNASWCARKVGVDRRMTTRAWKRGWPRYAWARPISEVLGDEYDAAKARVQSVEQRAAEEAQREREQAREAAVEARTEEERMISVARKDVLGALVIGAELVPAMRTLGQLITKAIARIAEDPAASQLQGRQLRDALELVDRHARLISKAVHAADAIVKLSRLERGQPGYMVGVGPAGSVDDEAATMSDAQAVLELEHAADLLQEMRAAGVLPAELQLAVGRIDEADDGGEGEPVN